MTTFDDDLHRAVGMSDLASLLAAAFRFPEDEALAHALTDGSFMEDWRASWNDACGSVDGYIAEEDEACFSASYEELRREYSRLFLLPGGNTPVWIYESCFCHRASGATGIPNLFGTRCSLDVEHRMREAGVVPAKVHTEPVDSAHLEFEFLAYLYARWGEALRLEQAVAEAAEDADPGAGFVSGDAADAGNVGNADSKGVSSGDEHLADAGESDANNVPAIARDASVWRKRIAEFAAEHALVWLPDFFSQVKQRSRISAYRQLVDLGAHFMDELKRDAQRFSA